MFVKEQQVPAIQLQNEPDIQLKSVSVLSANTPQPDDCILLAERTGLEPATPGVTGRYSNQLNYRSEGCVFYGHMVFSSSNFIEFSKVS